MVNFLFLRVLKGAVNMNAGSQLARTFLWQSFLAITLAFPSNDYKNSENPAPLAAPVAAFRYGEQQRCQHQAMGSKPVLQAT